MLQKRAHIIAMQKSSEIALIQSTTLYEYIQNIFLIILWGF